MAAADEPRGPPLINPAKQSKSHYQNSGTLIVDHCSIAERPSFLDYIAGEGGVGIWLGCEALPRPGASCGAAGMPAWRDTRIFSL